MSDWVAFDGVVEPVNWGKATYTILRLPEAAVTALGATKRVEGEIGEHWVNLALSRAPVVEGVFLWAGASLLERTGIVPGGNLWRCGCGLRPMIRWTRPKMWRLRCGRRG